MTRKQADFRNQILMIRSTELDFLTAIEGEVSLPILQQRERIKRKTLETRRLHHRQRAA